MLQIEMDVLVKIPCYILEQGCIVGGYSRFLLVILLPG